METLFWCFLAILFLGLNILIVYRDKTEEIIPNKLLFFLILLLPFWYAYAFWYGHLENMHIGIFLLQICITFLVWFTIFMFRIWWAGDAKYVCVLGFYIPHIGILPFIWNIWLATLFYLLLYFLNFWLGKNLWIKKSRQDFYKNMWIIKKEEFLHKYWKMDYRRIFFKILQGLNIFLIAFIAIRFAKMYVITYLSTRYDIVAILLEHGMYILLFSIALTFAIIIAAKQFFGLLQKRVFRSPNDEVYFLCAISFFGIAMLFYGYSLAPEFFSQKLTLIFTLYLLLYIIFRTLWSSIKLTFKMQEQALVPIENIREWMVIDKKWFDLILARDRDILWEVSISGNNLTAEDAQTVRSVLKTVNKHEEILHVPTIKTFGFALCIFWGFALTFFYDSLIIQILIKLYEFILHI